MVGDPRFNVHGWKQLAEWSIQYSCLDKAAQTEAMRIFRKRWEAFCEWIVAEHGPYADSLVIEG